MTSGPTFDEMAAALKAATMEIDAVEIQRRMLAAEDAAAEIPVLDLVAVAHSVVVPHAFDAVEAAVRTRDDTWVTGRRQEIVRIVAAVAVSALLRDADRRLLAALGCQSASFLGYESSIDQLGPLADATVFAESTDGRSREAITALSTSSRKLLHGQQDLEGPQAVSAVRALARRFEEVSVHFSTRLDRMDEELNTLWWSRKGFHSGSGVAWSELAATERVVRAALEIEEFVHIAPAARGTIEVLNEVAATSDGGQDVPLLDIAEVLIGTAHAGSSLSHHLLPLSSAASALAKYKNQREVTSSVVNESTGLDTSRSVPLAGLGEQLLREYSIMRVA